MAALAAAILSAAIGRAAAADVKPFALTCEGTLVSQGGQYFFAEGDRPLNADADDNIVFKKPSTDDIAAVRTHSPYCVAEISREPGCPTCAYFEVDLGRARAASRRRFDSFHRDDKRTGRPP
jgi:hypothetical protein